MKTFKHSGDMGDIIYSLPTIKALGGGILYLSITKRHCRYPGMPTKFNGECYKVMKPLLMRQPYIEDVRLWNDEEVDYDLDKFRLLPNIARTNLAKLHCDAFGVDPSVINEKWLEVEKGEMPEGKTVIFARSARYPGHFDWDYYIKTYGDKAIFIGLKEEHEAFVKKFNCPHIPFVPTKDFLELGRLIMACDLFVSNQSSPFSIAQGLHKRNRLEVSISSPNNIFEVIE